ncbi:MAG: hypothetical protein JXA15_05630 [Spirochaetales bacterium]|nr:hypothetical protein [Spirochaetales bacterium]
MPVVSIEYVRSEDEGPARDTLAQELADGIGTVLEAAEGSVWVRLHELAPSRYAENGGGGSAFSPVFADVLLKDFERDETLDGRTRELARSIGRVLGRPAENVHILYGSSARGRVAFGGVFVD